MAQSIEESLLQAIKKDDIKAFNALTEKARGAYRLGRFPVLSLLYLYKARRILSVHEQNLLKITNFEVLREPAEISKKFSAKAGKCLRLYFGTEVSPAEMLLILDRISRLKRIYPLTKQSDGVRERLKTIYYVKYALNVKFENGNIILDRRPLSYREKKNIATAVLCSVLAVTVAVGVPVTAVALIPERVEGEVTKLSQIDFASQTEYTLKRDIVLPENYSVEKVNCKINGDGNKLIFGNGATLGELNGCVSGLIIESTGGALFTSLSEKATIQNVTVNVNSDVCSAEGSAPVAVTNYGTIDGVTVNVSGKITAYADGEQVASELAFGGVVRNNSARVVSNTVYRGVIKNCTVNYSGFSLEGEASANASFGGVAGVNIGYVQNCTVTGEINADTFDVAGICADNSGVISDNINEANLYQTSSDTGWNPITCGIVLSNGYQVYNCENRGKISSVSACGQFEAQEGNTPAVWASGIAYLNGGSTASAYIGNCANYGGIECTAQYRNAYASGVCLSSSFGIEQCENAGSITVRTGNGFGMYVGGITAIAYGNIYNSVNEGDIVAEGNGVAYAGGISAVSCALFSDCLAGGNISVTANNVCTGGITGLADVNNYGFAIVGYCISESAINVNLTGEAPAYVGGIAGLVREAGYYASGGEVRYLGACINSCYFTGTCVSSGEYFGSIAGVCGANIYESNSFSWGFYSYINFENNYYTDSLGAFGAASSGEGDFVSVGDKGATSASIEEIQNDEIYREILTALGK